MQNKRTLQGILYGAFSGTLNGIVVGKDGKVLVSDQVVASFTLSQIFGQIISQKLAQRRAAGQVIKKKLLYALSDIGISQPTWSRVMGGKSALALDKMSDLCDVLELDSLAILAEVMALSKKLSTKDDVDNEQSMEVHYKNNEHNNDAITNGITDRDKYFSAMASRDKKQPATLKQVVATKEVLRYFIEQVKNTGDEQSMQSR